MRSRILFILPILIAAFVASAVHAQNLPATPGPADCTLIPLQPDYLTAIVAGGFQPAANLMETRRAVTPDEVETVTTVVTQSLACTNANDALAALSVYTDRYLAEHFAGDAGSDELGHLIAASTRNPGPAADVDYVVLISVTNPIWYSGNRIGISVTTTNADSTYVDRLIFVEVDNVWKIDQVLLNIDGTPVASPSA